MTTLLKSIIAALIAAFGWRAVAEIVMDDATGRPEQPATQPEPEPQPEPVSRPRKARKRPDTDNRVTYRVIALPAGKARAAEIKRRAGLVLLPMEQRTFDYVSAHPGQSARQIADATEQNGKTVESALYRLRRIARMVESVGPRGDAKK